MEATTIDGARQTALKVARLMVRVHGIQGAADRARLREEEARRASRRWTDPEQRYWQGVFLAVCRLAAHAKREVRP